MNPIFERLLAAQVLATLVACGPSPATAEELCEGNRPSGYGIEDGYIAVEPGEDCPAAKDLDYLSSENCCPSPIFHAVCSFTEKRENQVSDGYAGYYDAGGDTGMSYGDLVDVCWYSGVFESNPDGACCGRPLLQEGRPILADASQRDDWMDEVRPDVSAMSPEARAAAGAYWLVAARMEHASVASFARFTLELIRFGAPPELLSASQQAGLDEVVHAQLCFALASAYLGQPVGPSAVDLGEAAALAPSRAAFAEAILTEGCIGETLAVLDAAARLARATDPVVKLVLKAILDDESRHSALAWRVLRWVLDGDDGTVRDHLVQVFERERGKTHSGATHAVPTGHGLIAERVRRGVLRDGWDRVIGPSWEALLA